MNNFTLGNKSNYTVVNIPMDAAFNDWEFPHAFTRLEVISASAAVSVKLHDKHINSSIPIVAGDIIYDDYGVEKLYITSAATPGGILKLLLSHGINFGRILPPSSGGGGGSGVAPSTTCTTKNITCTLAATEYSVALSTGAKQLLITNPDNSAIIKIAFVATTTSTGAIVLPQKNIIVADLNFTSKSLYAQCNTAGVIVGVQEFS